MLPDVFALDGLTDAAFRLHLLAVRMCLDLGLGSLPAGRAKALGKQRAIDELLSKGVWTDDGTGYQAADFVAAYPQEARLQVRKTDAERSKAYRQRRNRHDRHVTECDASRDDRHAESDERHGPSRDAVTATVTPALPSHTLPSPPPPLDSGSSLISGSSEPSSDLTGSAREAAKGRLSERLRQPTAEAGAAPRPRHDPLGERISFASWFPSSAMLAWCKARGLTDAELDVTLIEARDGLTGRHEFDWFDAKVWKYIDVALLRKANPGGTRAGRVQANTDWPTEDAARLREAIRSGQHGKGLAAKLDAGQLDYPLAQRLIRERQEAAGRRPDGQVGVPPPGDLSALIRGVGRAMP